MTEFDASRWRRLAQRVKDQKCTPFLGAGMSWHLFGETANWVERWIKDEDLPIPKTAPLDYVAQMISVKWDGMAPKDDFASSIQCAKNYDPRDKEDPFSLLVDAVRVPIYITTNYDSYLEQALRSDGRNPRTVICPWHHDIKHLGPRDIDPPSVAAPWVYHLHGHYEHPDSMVLTEDDYTDFLVELGTHPDILHYSVEKALGSTSLLFLGYGLRDMTFRVLLRGVFRPRQKAIKRNGITVQLPKPPNDDDLKKEWDEALRERYQKLFERYFYNMSFDVYWGDQKEFLRTLRDFICEDPRAP